MVACANAFGDTDWVWAVLQQWGVLLTGGIIMALLTGVQWWQEKTFPWSVNKWILILFLFAAFFMAWREQYRKAKDAEVKLAEIVAANKPDFSLATNQATFGVSNPALARLHATEAQKEHLATDDNDVITMIILGVEIINKGAPSVAIHWSAHYLSPTLNQEFGIARVLSKMDVGTSPGLPTLTIEDSDIIDAKTTSPIQRGGYVSGRLPIFVPGDRRRELETGSASIKVTTHDYLGKSYTATFTGKGRVPIVSHYPGEKGSGPR
jgi:hypothetical protein